MKKQIQISGVIISLLMVFSLVPTAQVFAATSVELKFEPSSQTVTTGESVTMKLVAAVTDYRYRGYRVAGKINFPKNIVTITNLSTAGTAYTASGSTSTYDNAAGTISFNRLSYGGSSNMLVFTVTFKTIGAGAATLAFDPSASTQTTALGKLSNGLITARNPTCPAGQVGTPPNCTTPAPTPTPNPTPTPTPTPTPDIVLPTLEPSPDDTPVQIDAGDLSVRDVKAESSWKENKMSWATTLPDATSTLDIGTTKNNLKLDSTVSRQEDGNYTAKPNDLLPGTRYYYRITATAVNDVEKKATYSGAFTTKGYPVVLKIMQDDQPLIGGKISIENGSYTTDKNGTVNLELANKKFTATLTSGDTIKQTIEFTVAKKALSSDGAEPEAQVFSFAVTEPTSDESSPPLPLGLIAASGVGALLMIGGFAGFLIYRRRKAEQLAAPVMLADEYNWSPDQQQQSFSQPIQYDETTPLPTEPTEQPFNATPEYNIDTLYLQEVPAPTPQITTESPAYPTEDTTGIPESIANQTYEPTSLPPEDSQQSIGHADTILPTQSTIPQDIEELRKRDETLTPPQPQNEQPSSIYDPATEELDILHTTVTQSSQQRSVHHPGGVL